MRASRPSRGRSGGAGTGAIRHPPAALETFRALGAAAWADRAAGELRATGETVRPRDADGVSSLTPQELPIARRVAGGASDKEVAAQLFISPKTVEYHLGKVYGKLGVRSRADLARAGLSDQPSSASTSSHSAAV